VVEITAPTRGCGQNTTRDRTTQRSSDLPLPGGDEEAPPMTDSDAPPDAEPATSAALTQLLAAARGGDGGARERLFAAVYDELRRIAHRQLAGRRPGQTLSTTALVHEAYVKLAAANGAVAASDRAHFFALAARAMRQILIDYARSRWTAKRGAGVAAVSLDDLQVAVAEKAEEVLAVDAALRQLEANDARLGQVVEWRFFGGLSMEEIASALGVSDRTIKRDWQKARAYLYRELVRSGAIAAEAPRG
jgi:RNA polymerase sigma factor (TIGR02999 family)